MPLRLCYPRNLSVTIISFDICDNSVHRLPISKKSASIANNKTEKKCEKGTALKLKTFKMYRKARKSFQGTIMPETLWGAQSLFSFQVEEKELLSACGETINLIALRKILRSDGNVTHSLNPWLTHSPLLLKNSNMWILHPQCSTSVHQVMMSKKPGFTSGPRWAEEKRIPFLPSILFVVENRLSL